MLRGPQPDGDAPAGTGAQAQPLLAAQLVGLQLSAAPQWSALLHVVQQLTQDLHAQKQQKKTKKEKKTSRHALHTAEALQRLAACARAPAMSPALLLQEIDNAAAAAEKPSLVFAMLAAQCELGAFAAGVEFDGIGPATLHESTLRLQLLECKASPMKGAPRRGSCAAGLALARLWLLTRERAATHRPQLQMRPRRFSLARCWSPACWASWRIRGAASRWCACSAWSALAT